MRENKNEDAKKDEEEEEEEQQVITQQKSNYSFIVSLASRRRGNGRNLNERIKQTTTPQIEIEESNEIQENILHSITVLGLEQYHAITERYRFAIPEMETRCICECESGSANCAAAHYKYGQCSEEEIERELEGGGDYESIERIKWAYKRNENYKEKSLSVCHRTFFANQPTGEHCSRHEQYSSNARLCCQLKFRAFRDRKFVALKLENAVSSVLLQYSQWNWKENNEKNPKLFKKGYWEELEKRKIRIQLDGAIHNTILSENSGLKLSVLGLAGAKSAGVQLDAGVYFAEIGSDGTVGELIGQMPVNRITEHDFHKLGWLRLDERNKPFVQAGEVFIDKIHHARAEDCATQRYRSVLDASYYINSDNNATTQFKIPETLNHVHKWIRSAKVLDSNQRIALVRVSEGLSLELTLSAQKEFLEESSSQKQRLITFVHNSSKLGDFTALLIVDKFSNSFLNLTLFNASGVLNGYVRPLNDLYGNTEIDGFSVNVPNNEENNEEKLNNKFNKIWMPISVQTRIKPYPLGSIHLVCLRPDDGELSRELCRPVQSVYYELEQNTMQNEWNEAIGACKECNKISAEGFAKYLNPANWVKGIGSVSEALMLASDIIGYLIVILIFYVLLSKVIIPLFGCCFTCTPTYKCFGRKK
uniref:Phlebovirus glycoprotein G2 fusion domain-containing protein n=1 Tax=Meloidogyne hapla TaxID=6305 RepID=A0A1I8BFN7_MELHA